MENFLKIAAGIFAILFVVTTAFAFALYNVEHSAFDTELYINAFEAANVYQRLPELTSQTLAVAARKPDRNDMLSLFRNLSDEEWRIFVTELFPPDILESLARDSVAQIMAYLNGQSETAVLSLTSFKSHLQSQKGINAVYGMLKSQPDCTLEQLTAIVLNQQAMALCNPPERFLFVDLRPIIETEIKRAMSLIPEQITIISEDSNRLQTLRDLRALRLFMRLSPLVPVLCLIVATALTVRSLNDWLTWWGIPLFLAGLISMSLSALSGLIAAGTFQFFIAPVLPGTFPQGIVNVFRDLTAAIVHNAVQPTLPIAGLMTFTGLTMIVLTFLLRRTSDNS